MNLYLSVHKLWENYFFLDHVSTNLWLTLYQYWYHVNLDSASLDRLKAPRPLSSIRFDTTIDNPGCTMQHNHTAVHIIPRFQKGETPKCPFSLDVPMVLSLILSGVLAHWAVHIYPLPLPPICTPGMYSQDL